MFARVVRAWCAGCVWSRSSRPPVRMVVAGLNGHTDPGWRTVMACRSRCGISYASTGAVAAGSRTGRIVMLGSAWVSQCRNWSNVTGPCSVRTTPCCSIRVLSLRWTWITTRGPNARVRRGERAEIEPGTRRRAIERGRDDRTGGVRSWCGWGGRRRSGGSVTDATGLTPTRIVGAVTRSSVIITQLLVPGQIGVVDRFQRPGILIRTGLLGGPAVVVEIVERRLMHVAVPVGLPARGGQIRGPGSLGSARCAPTCSSGVGWVSGSFACRASRSRNRAW